MRLPDQIVLARMARPMVHERLAEPGGAIGSYLVDVRTLRDCYDRHWPRMEISLHGCRWRAWTWLGWSLVLLWKTEDND